MDLVFFLKGMFCGVVIAAPVGPVGILCVKRTLQYGFRVGLISGAGASTADAIFGMVAAFGLHFVADLMVEHSRSLRLIGGVLMILVGVYELVTAPEGPEPPRRPRSKSNLGRYTSTFLLTVTNPITILSFGAVFAVAGAVAPAGDLFAAWTLVAGVLSGSLLWFSALCGFSRLFRHRIDADGMRVVSRASGVLVIVFGVIVLLTLTAFSKRTFGI